MNVSLTIPERLHMLMMLPKQGDVLTLKTVRVLNEKVGFSESDIINYEIKQEGTEVSWNNLGNTPVEIEFSEPEVHLIKQELTTLDNNKMMTMDLLPIYDKFM